MPLGGQNDSFFSMISVGHLCHGFLLGIWKPFHIVLLLVIELCSRLTLCSWNIRGAELTQLRSNVRPEGLSVRWSHVFIYDATVLHEKEKSMMEFLCASVRLCFQECWTFETIQFFLDDVTSMFDPRAGGWVWSGIVFQQASGCPVGGRASSRPRDVTARKTGLLWMIVATVADLGSSEGPKAPVDIGFFLRSNAGFNLLLTFLLASYRNMDLNQSTIACLLAWTAKFFVFWYYDKRREKSAWRVRGSCFLVSDAKNFSCNSEKRIITCDRRLCKVQIR